jgi:ubiquinol-cytochrome c reductase cytochrome c subunit
MKSALIMISLFAGAIGIAAQQSAPKETKPAPAGDAVNGKKIYASYGCYQCHNYAANGGAAGPRLAPNPIPFGEFSRYVRKPTGDMPPYTSKVVTDKEIADIYAYLGTIPKPVEESGK